MDIYVFCVLLGRVFCVGLITRPEEFTECGVFEHDLEDSTMRPWPARDCRAMNKYIYIYIHVIFLVTF